MKITVVGQPITQGSKSGFPFRRKDGSLGVAMTEGKKSASLKEWRGAIAAAARVWIDLNGHPAPLDGPLGMSATFYLPKPKSAPKGLEWPAKKPDLSKLIRGVEDALTAIIYVDDSRIVVSHIEKRFAIASPPRVEIEILPIAEFWNKGWKTENTPVALTLTPPMSIL